ncbi:MAG: hypothetical protein ACOX6D_01740 [Thermoguttaceae bacterium]
MTKAALHGHDHVQRYLGNCYYYGLGVKQDKKRPPYGTEGQRRRGMFWQSGRSTKNVSNGSISRGLNPIKRSALPDCKKRRVDLEFFSEANRLENNGCVVCHRLLPMSVKRHIIPHIPFHECPGIL